MASTQNQAPNADHFDAYFRRADLDRDGRISGAEAVAFFQGSGLPKQVLAQIWNYADQNRSGYLGRPEFYNALKLVTVAQSKRDLTPEIVKAALYGPASAKIPAPQINFAASPVSQSNSVAPASTSHSVAVAPSPVQNFGPRGPQVPPSTNVNQQHFTHQGSQLVRPVAPVSVPASHSMHGVGNQGFPMGSSIAGVQPPSSSVKNDLVGGQMIGKSAVAASLAPSSGINPPTSQAGFAPPATGSTTTLPPRPPAASKMMPNMPQAKDPKGLGFSANGVASNSNFGGDAFSATPSHPKQDSSVGNIPVSSASASVSAGNGYSFRPGSFDSSQATQRAVRPPTPQPNLVAKSSQQGSIPSTSGFTSPVVSVGAGNSAPGQPQQPWPKLTQPAIQKYTKVFVAVDTDKDGKITGEQARNLFLSWRLPREVLKQVWDLSDQDNDSMLSLREFCIALYLMERFREGRPIPPVLPSGIFDALAAGPSMTGFNTASWKHQPGVQPQATPASSGSQHAAPVAGARPPLPVSPRKAEEGSEMNQQKSKVPVLEKHLVDQLSKEEQDSLNSKFKEASDSEKKVEELEKEIRDSREKIQFYSSKMQELVLYKSRCDNRLNEITERVAADKREVELLAKKYEEKYKQSGDVASRLTIEESTFRDIQEKKMELYQAIVKMQQNSSPDGNHQAHAERLQSDLDELVKNLSERCKQYGLRGRPTSLLELPFGWQPGIQEGTADWDEDWDKFADEGYTFVKELTLDVQNVVAPPKTKHVPASKSASTVESATGEATTEVTAETIRETASPKAEDTVESEKPPIEHKKVVENGSAVHERTEDASVTKPESPVAKSIVESPSKEFMGAEPGKASNAETSTHDKETQRDRASMSMFDKSFDEPSWGTFDTNDDTDSVWGFNPDSSSKGNDSVTFGENDFFGSGDFGLNPIRTQPPKEDNLFQKKSAFFDESVPSTPLYSSTNSPQKYRDSSQPSFDSFSRFDSFSSTHDSALFPPRETLSRFDSMRSTSDFDYGRGTISFDDSDPFGSGPFKTSLESQTPRRYSDSDPFNTEPYKTSLDNQTPRSFSDSDPFYSGFGKSFESRTPRRASDVDPFGNQPFRQSSLDSQTPRSTFDSDFFGSQPHKTLSLDSQTPRSTFDSDFFGTGSFKRSTDNQTPKGSGSWSDF